MNFYNLQNITETLIFIVPLRFYVRFDIPTGSNRRHKMSPQFMVETSFVLLYFAMILDFNFSKHFLSERNKMNFNHECLDLKGMPNYKISLRNDSWVQPSWFSENPKTIRNPCFHKFKLQQEMNTDFLLWHILVLRITASKAVIPAANFCFQRMLLKLKQTTKCWEKFPAKLLHMN